MRTPLVADAERSMILESPLLAICGTLDLEQVLARVFEAARRLLRVERALVLLRENGGSLVVRGVDGLDPTLGETRLAASAGVFGRALARREPVCVDANGLDEPLAAAVARLEPGVVAPLVVGKRALGVLVLASPARPWSPPEQRLFAALADHAATAIDHALRYEAAMARGERLATLLDFTQRVAEHRPYDDLLRLIAEEARRLLRATTAAFRLVEGDELAVAVSTGGGESAIGPARVKFGQDLCGRVAASGQPLRIADTLAGGGEAAADLAALARAGIRSYLGVPLVARDQVTGVLCVYAREPHQFDRDDTALLAGFAGQAAVAIENARLIQQLLHAERLSAVGRIVAGVAHELNNPLAVVVGTADLIRREHMDPRLAERLDRIAAHAQRAVKIVRSLLSLARKKPAQRVLVDVNRLVGETLELEGYEFRTGRVTVVKKLGTDVHPVQGDPDQLQQVLTNLMLNAVEAMREVRGGGTLTVTTRSDRLTDRVVVAVADDGPGIEPRDVQRIFEPFFTTKGEGKGTGLGLAICRQIVESHHGRLTVESQPGAGATFTIDLPAAVDVPAARPALRHLPDAVRAETGTGRGADVLLVEDDRFVGDLLAEYLELDGHRVDRAANGREALGLVRARPYALIISDVRMPDVDGPAFYHELGTIAPELTRRVVFVTGDVMSPDTRRFLDATGLLFLEKPFGIAEFQTVVRRALAQSAESAVRPAQTA